VRTPPKKKQRLSAPDSRAADAVDFVPSSQQDEQGLVDPLKSVRKTVDEVSDIVSRWREATLIPSDVPPLQDDPPSFGADTDVYADFSPPVPELDADMPLAEESSSNTRPDVTADWPRMTFFTSCPGTPSKEQLNAAQMNAATNLSLPSTPVALNAESKAAQIIAQIKANAFQARYSSPDDEIPTEVPDLEDSSDEDEDIFSTYRPPNVTNADR
jgi:hypothetical protein